MMNRFVVLADDYGVGAGSGVARRRFGRGGFRTCLFPSFVIRTRIPLAVVIICEPSGKVRIVTPPGMVRTSTGLGRAGPRKLGGVGTSGGSCSCPCTSTSTGGWSASGFFFSSFRGDFSAFFGTGVG